MVSRAVAKYIRVSPRKTRYVLDTIRGRGVEDAFAVLANINKGAAFYIRQVLKSALGNAVDKTKGEADASNLYISKATADGGPMLKRWRAASMGRANSILKRTSHIVIELDMTGQQEVAAKKIENKIITNKTRSQKSKVKSQKTEIKIKKQKKA